MLKIAALVLLVANALLLAAQWGVFDRLTVGDAAQSQREPERLARQVRTDAVQILSPLAASAALGASAAQSAAAARSAAAVACLETGPLGPADADAAERSLRDAGLATGSWVVQKTDDRGDFMVYMGRFADRDVLQGKQEQLMRLKVESEDARSTPEWQPGLNLGRFDNKPAADAALAQLVQRGVRTARVITLRPAQAQTVLRLPAADAALRARLVGLRLVGGVASVAFVACSSAAGPAVASVAPAAAPASAPKLASAAASAAQPAWR